MAPEARIPKFEGASCGRSPPVSQRQCQSGILSRRQQVEILQHWGRRPLKLGDSCACPTVVPFSSNSSAGVWAHSLEPLARRPLAGCSFRLASQPLGPRRSAQSTLTTPRHEPREPLGHRAAPGRFFAPRFREKQKPWLINRGGPSWQSGSLLGVTTH